MLHVKCPVRTGPALELWTKPSYAAGDLCPAVRSTQAQLWLQIMRLIFNVSHSIFEQVEIQNSNSVFSRPVDPCY